ncbi:unnamed protein product, partial [Owenia fusiformis]
VSLEAVQYIEMNIQVYLLLVFIALTATLVLSDSSGSSSRSKKIRENRKCGEIKYDFFKPKKGECEEGTECKCDEQKSKKIKCYCRAVPETTTSDAATTTSDLAITTS